MRATLVTLNKKDKLIKNQRKIWLYPFDLVLNTFFWIRQTYLMMHNQFDRS
jgi:predicted amidohydrolase